jgi:hypothetical protein
MVCSQVLHETVLFAEAFSVANCARVAFDEDISVASFDDTCGRERAGAGGYDFDWDAGRGNFCEERADFVEGQRRPVRLDQ